MLASLKVQKCGDSNSLAFLDFSILNPRKNPSLSKLKNLLLYRFILTNGIGFFLFLGMCFTGYANEVFSRDPIHFSYVLISIFVLGLIVCYRRIVEVGGAIDNLGNVIPMDMPAVRLAANKMPAKNKIVFVTAEWLTLLGLVGNLLGLYVMLKGAGDADAAALSHQMLAGLGVAFGATLVGALTGLWLWVNFHLVETATSLYIEDVKSK